MQKPFESFFAREFDEFIIYRKKLGLDASTSRHVLLIFDRYLKEQKLEPALLEPSFFLELRANLKLAPSTVNGILSTLRSFFNFLMRRGLYDHNPLKDIPPLPKRYFVPFIFSSSQTEQLLEAVWQNIRRTPRLFPFDMGIYLSIMMLAHCGMRINEPLRLLKHHYRSDDCTIYIEKTKFRKDRLIPVPKALVKEFENYLAVRKVLCPDDRNPYFLSGKKLRPLEDKQIRSVFHQAVKDVGLNRERQMIGDLNFGAPTPHSLRHSFAINTLKRIKERGRSAQQALPVLAAYMGHRRYQYTAAYLKVSDAEDVTGLIEFAKSQLDAI